MNWLARIKTAINHHILEEVVEHYNDRGTDLQFPHIFGEGEMRKVVPFASDADRNIAEQLKQHGYEVDLQRGVALQTFKDQMGNPKKREAKLGRVIGKVLGPEALKEWEKAGGGGKYSIIVSRSPVDLLRMSDFKNIQSCHSEGGMYWDCAIAEAKEGGAIAYVVNNDNLAEVEDVNAPEIFADRDRRLPGINPVSRLRLRQYLKKDGTYDLAVPETRTYGNKIDGFYDSVKDWAYQAQQNVLEGQRPRMKDFYRSGGAYMDTQSSELFNDFFGDNLDRGEAEYQGIDDKGNLFELWTNEVEAMDSQYPISNKNVHCSADVQEDDDYGYGGGGATLHAWAEVLIPFDENLNLIEQKLTEMAGAENHTNRWSLMRKLTDGIYKLPSWPNLNIELLRWEDNDIRISISSDAHNPDQYADLRSEMADISKNYNKIAYEIVDFMVQNGWAEAPDEYTEFNGALNDLQLQNFEVGTSDGELDLKSLPFQVGDLTENWQQNKELLETAIFQELIARVEKREQAATEADERQMKLFPVPRHQSVNFAPSFSGFQVWLDGDRQAHLSVSVGYSDYSQLQQAVLTAKELDQAFDIIPQVVEQLRQQSRLQFSQPQPVQPQQPLQAPQSHQEQSMPQPVAENPYVPQIPPQQPPTTAGNWYKRLLAQSAGVGDVELGDLPQTDMSTFVRGHNKGAKMWVWRPDTGLEIDEGFGVNHTRRWGPSAQETGFRGRFDPTSNVVFVYLRQFARMPSRMVADLERAFPGATLQQMGR